MAVTYSRLLPDAAILVRAVLETSGAECSSTPPPKLASKVPIFTAYRFGGAAVHPQFLDRATMQVIAWGSTYVQARDLAETGRVLLFQAWREQWHTAEGVLHRFSEVVAPSEIRTGGQPDNVWRFDATYSIFARP